MKSLIDSSVIRLNTSDLDKPLLGVLFKKDCVPCRKQIRDLNCLKEKFFVFLIGAYSSESSLRQEYLKFKTNFPAYLASTDLLESLKLNSAATPVLIKFEDHATTIFTGYKKCEAYKRIL